MRYIGIPDPQNEVYWYGIEIRSKSEISNNEVLYDAAESGRVGQKLCRK